MFFSQFVLAKKGPLGKVWLAAHWDRKLTKAEIYKTDIFESVETIMNPKVPMALRMSGHLLLGVVRIYSRKVKYLLSDCSDALVKIKMAFRPGIVDLPTESAVAPLATITLPEKFGEYDITMPTDEIELPSEEDLLSANRVAHRISITLHQELGGVEMLAPGSQITPDDLFQQLVQPHEEETDLRGRESRPMTPDVGRAGEGIDAGISPAQVGGRFDDSDLPDMWDETVPHGIGEYNSTILPELHVAPATPVSGRFSDVGLPIPQISIERPGLAKTPPPEAIGESPTKRGEKRKRVTADTATTLSSEIMKEHLDNVAPIMRELEPAPATKKAMRREEVEVRLPQEALTTPANIELAGCPELMALFRRAMTRDAEVTEEAAPPSPRAPKPSPWHDVSVISPVGSPKEYDYGAPDVSHYEEPQVAAEEQTEADREREEKKREEELVPVESWSERTLRMQRFLRQMFDSAPSIKELSFKALVEGQSKKVVAGTFFEFLVLKTKNRIDLRQEYPYGDILVSKTPKFESGGTTPRRPSASSAAPATTSA